MDARPIGQFVRPIIARALHMAAFQQMLNAADAGDRENIIIAAHQHGELDRDDAALLLREAAAPR